MTNSVVFINLAIRQPVQQFQLDATHPRFGPMGGGESDSIAVSADLATIVQSLGDGRVKIWNTATAQTRTVTVSDRPVELIALSADGQTLIAGGRGPDLRVCDLRSGTNTALPVEAMRVLLASDGHTLAVFAGGFSRGPQRGGPPAFWSTSPLTNTVQLWDLTTRSLRTNLVIGIGAMDAPPGVSAAFSPDGRVFAAANFDVIRLWDIATGAPLGECIGHKQAVQAIAFAPDGKTLASASGDSTLKLWNVATQQELFTARRPGKSVAALLFSPDGRVLVEAGDARSQSAGLQFYRAPAFAETDAPANSEFP